MSKKRAVARFELDGPALGVDHEDEILRGVERDPPVVGSLLEGVLHAFPLGDLLAQLHHGQGEFIGPLLHERLELPALPVEFETLVDLAEQRPVAQNAHREHRGEDGDEEEVGGEEGRDIHDGCCQQRRHNVNEPDRAGQGEVKGEGGGDETHGADADDQHAREVDGFVAAEMQDHDLDQGGRKEERGEAKNVQRLEALYAAGERGHGEEREGASGPVHQEPGGVSRRDHPVEEREQHEEQGAEDRGAVEPELEETPQLLGDELRTIPRRSGRVQRNVSRTPTANLRPGRPPRVFPSMMVVILRAGLSSVKARPADPFGSWAGRRWPYSSVHTDTERRNPGGGLDREAPPVQRGSRAVNGSASRRGSVSRAGSR